MIVLVVVLTLEDRGAQRQEGVAPAGPGGAADPARLGGSLALPQDHARRGAMTAPLRFAASVAIASI